MTQVQPIQPTLPELAPLVPVEHDPDADLEARFWDFHAQNPHVYDAIVAAARSAKARGVQRWGMRAVFEVLRWHSMLATDGEPWKLNNSFTPWYARLAMTEPDLDGFFHTRDSLGPRVTS